MILMLGAGRGYTEIQERLQTTAPTISRWKKRFLKDGINGLIEVRRPGQKPTVITAKFQAKVLEATRRKPKDGSTHWSFRLYLDPPQQPTGGTSYYWFQVLRPPVGEAGRSPDRKNLGLPIHPGCFNSQPELRRS